jgi:hypothetical protein
MDIRNLDLPTFKRFYRRIHFADSNALAKIDVDDQFKVQVIGLVLPIKPKMPGKTPKFPSFAIFIQTIFTNYYPSSDHASSLDAKFHA